jgi:hypothetical protein
MAKKASKNNVVRLILLVIANKILASDVVTTTYFVMCAETRL